MFIKFHRNTATLIHLVHVVCGCFHTVTAELSSYNRNYRPTKLKLFTICPLQKKKIKWLRPSLHRSLEKMSQSGFTSDLRGERGMEVLSGHVLISKMSKE